MESNHHIMVLYVARTFAINSVYEQILTEIGVFLTDRSILHTHGML